MLSLITKFGFKYRDSVLLINPPLEYLEDLRNSDASLLISTRGDSGSPFDAIQIFVLNQLDIMELAPAAPAVLKKNGNLWFSFPSRKAGKPSDIDYDTSWKIMTDSGWVVAQVTSQLSGWSSLRFTELD